MKFVYFGYDFMLPAIMNLLEGAHTLVGIFSFECDGLFNQNTAAQDLAQNLSIPFSINKASDADLEHFLQAGCECFLAAGYPYKIPPIDENKAYGVNVHPAYLPYARGIMPVPHIILNHDEKAAGLSAHKMTQTFDGGDILTQIKFDLSKRETPETYMAKTQIAAQTLFQDLMQDLPALWKGAQEQDPNQASHYPAPSDQDRTLDWNQSCEQIDRRARAFGRFGSIAYIQERPWFVYAHNTWQQDHNLTPGTIAAHTHRDITIAVQDGFICLSDIQPAQENL